ncbi:MAG: capsule biosynthesis protein [Rhodobacterales bacterium]|nr:capsule biosynthesis protein [Rhodobacterales bacterium]
MITKLKAKRFRIRKPVLPAAPAEMAARPGPAALDDDGYPLAAPGDLLSPAEVAAEGEIDAIRREGLTGRQLRTARRVAQKHGLPATSDFDAVRLLRRAGIDPFQRASLLEVVAGGAEDGPPSPPPGGARALTALPGGLGLPQTVRPAALPGPVQRAEQTHAADILKIQHDLARRRRRKMALLTARLAFFVLLPTLIAGWYYYAMATPMYETKAEMVIQQADGAVTAGAPMGLSGMLGGALEANKDSIAVQGYLQSREAMARLDADHGFRAAFSDPAIDPIQRLDPGASSEAAYKLYQKHVKISYDPTEGILKMAVIAPDPEQSAEFSRALIRYAEEQIDQLSARKREDQMRDARASYEDAETKMVEAQRRLVELQEQFKIMSSEVEMSLITTQIGSLESQLVQERLSLAQMMSNPNPNAARMDPVRRRIDTLEAEVATLRARLSEDGDSGLSLAKVQGELLVAQTDVQTRQMILTQSLQQLETARIEANRQVRYLSVSVQPTAPDTAAYPRAFENTLVTLLIFAGIYLLISMTAAILREQVSA